MVSYKGREEEINIREYKIGNAYAEAYGRGLALSKAKKLDLAGNRFNEDGSHLVVKGISNHVEELDIWGIGSVKNL